MSPMATFDTHPLKRTASQAAFDLPLAKKANLSTTHHKANWDLQKHYRRDATLQGGRVAQDLLRRSINLALQAVGFEEGEDGALQSFQSQVEDYMAHYLSDVRQSMLSSRRRHVIPQDFLQALHTHQLSLRSLLNHLDPPVSPSKSQFFLEATQSDQEDKQYQNIDRSGFTEATHKPSYIPKHFPSLPDKHTYQSTPDFPVREQDPRQLREAATRESRYGEEALRGLVTSCDKTSKKKDIVGKPSVRERRHQLWLETIKAVSDQEKAQTSTNGDSMEMDQEPEGGNYPKALSSQHGHLSTSVNYEKKYWRKPAVGRGQ